ncbi:hypothetical protein EDD27_3149 [Nonomuraea polychroma]|uniref:Uncharacterized protein n=1 Tax=Nonomuraea polychroma TaxID=46176 RepID=A0A438M5L3_9ACTN|nr:hypothetical protein [Nonomuraea polychroma]RVX40728.1 hypothetical protein EDD27_3149 [Nonomuraea polychroma]
MSASVAAGALTRGPAGSRESVAVGAKDDVRISEYGGPDDYVGSGLSHWDGRSWKQVPTSSPYGDHDWVSRVAATGGGEVWAVIHSQGVATVTRRDGSGWATTPLPPAPGSSRARLPSFARRRLYGMAARAHDDAWLVTQGGSVRSGSCEVPDRGMVARWDGTAWTWLDLPLTESWLPAVRADRVGGVWIAANASRGQSYVLNLRDIFPVPGTTRLWALARRVDGTLLIYELA